MALTKTTTTSEGFEAVNSYIVCEAIRLYGKDRIAFQVRTHKEKGLPHFSDVSFESAYNIDGANPIKQSYEFLKTLPEFADAVDC
jgi:hypothetical protein